jgi:hypothetical protein
MTHAATPDQIVDDIERTREELGETIDALTAKLDARAAVQRRWPEIAVAGVTLLGIVIVWKRMA